MKNILLQQLENALPKGMQIPEELRQLYQWIEDNGYYEDRDGVRYGYLYPQDKLRESWKEDEREGGTDISFYVAKLSEREELLEISFGKHKEETAQCLLSFAQSGGDGSECALWLDDEGHTQIVHIGSGSGSMMTFGYDEICWDEYYPLPPNSDKNEMFVHPNTQYQEWVQNTFHTTIPKIGLEVATPHSMGDEATDDPFLNWFYEMTDE